MTQDLNEDLRSISSRLSYGGLLYSSSSDLATMLLYPQNSGLRCIKGRERSSYWPPLSAQLASLTTRALTTHTPTPMDFFALPCTVVSDDPQAGRESSTPTEKLLVLIPTPISGCIVAYTVLFLTIVVGCSPSVNRMTFG
jgi:hypothetical protein